MVSPKAKDKGTKGSHSVWRFYLKQFSVDGKIIHAYDVNSARRYKTSINSATVCNDIYSLTDEISPLDVIYIKSAASLNYPLDEQDHKIIDELVGFFNNDPKPFLHVPQHQADYFREIIKSKIGRESLTRNQEELFSYYEENFMPLYKMLLSGNSMFYNDMIEEKNALLGYMAAIALKTSNFLHMKFFDLLCRALAEIGMYDSFVREMRDDLKQSYKMMEQSTSQIFSFSSDRNFGIYYFIVFILTQFFRTQKHFSLFDLLQENADRNFPQYKGLFNYSNIICMLVHFQTFRMGINLVDEKFRIVLLHSNGEHDFITSDQPIINTYGALFTQKKFLDSKEFELYYPLSPKIALLFTDRDCYKKVNNLNLTPESVIAYNKLIRKSCLKTLYSQKMLS